ncbi:MULTISPECIES: MFS transporter [Streptomyces]|uniref:MFS transporter n=1 Tax=Streptomyces canarius TaxID=285453 RepID=A0ABQ3DC13_9ACTN|nr:MFS transporter [Streptomyces canarius]GHA72782.1 MFS transporter [Streptomyces canarius]
MSFVLVLSEFLPVGLLPAIGDSLHVNTGTAGLLVVVPGLAAAVAAPLLTVASGRLDRRHVLLTLAALITVSNALAALAPDMTVMIAARLLLGLGVGGFWAMGAGVGSRLVPPADADRAASFITAGISAGTVVSLPLGALIGHLAGWRAAFDIAAVAALLTLVFLRIALPTLKPTDTVRPASLGNVLRTPSAALALLATAVAFFGHFTAYTYITPHLQQHAHLSAGAVTAVLLGYGLAGLAGNFLVGLIAGRSLRVLAALTGLVLAAAVLLLTVATSTPSVITLVLLWGAAFGGVPPIGQARVMRLFPQAPEAALALLVTASQTFLAVGSFTGGVLTDHHGTTTAFAFGALVVLLSALVPVRTR